MKDTLLLIEQLCALSGTSGDESRVADFIEAQVKDYADKIWRDKLGNLLVFKKGKNSTKNKVMLAAHMDEVGFIITNITDEGLLRFAAVGGIDRRVVLGRQVFVGDNGIAGVIGTKAVHQQKPEEKGNAPEIDSLYIDIGASSKEQAQGIVQLGDRAVFASDYISFGDGLIKAKALDDRAGCAILIEILRKELKYDAYFAFTVQEEIGTRGAKVATFDIKPDFAIVVETTTAADIADVTADKQVCKLGCGPVISFMDRSTVYDRELYRLAFEVASENALQCQTKTAIAGGNDSGAIHTSIGGVRTLAISMPCRYLHSACSVLKEEDIAQTKVLVSHMLKKMAVL